jgi:2',3'-cyclic-nucleotide 2'-phosphodiesterase (5'-nucleotidase family)
VLSLSPYCILGNHEADIPFTSLIQRIRESKFNWINTNMKDLKLPADIPPIPDFCEVEVKNGEHTRRIALLGLITEEPTLYLRGAFGGATISPLIDSAKEYHTKLMTTGRYDAIVPLTHQTIEEDRKLLHRVPQFPIVVGGHDHEPFNEVVNHCTVLKMGMDATQIGIIELTWPDPSSTAPLVSITSRPATYYEPDPMVSEVAHKHLKLLEHVKKSPLFTIPSDLKAAFSSATMREAPSPVAMTLLNILRDALEVDCCLFNAGAIRAGKDYSNQSVRRKTICCYFFSHRMILISVFLFLLILVGVLVCGSGSRNAVSLRNLCLADSRICVKASDY